MPPTSLCLQNKVTKNEPTFLSCTKIFKKERKKKGEKILSFFINREKLLKALSIRTQSRNMGKKRKSIATSLDEVDRTMYASFCSTANSLSQLYTQAMNQQKLSFQAGKGHSLVLSLSLNFWVFIRMQYYIDGFLYPIFESWFCVFLG